MKLFGRKWMSGLGQVRRPASRLRQAVGVLMVILTVAGFVGYRYFTTEARLRHYASVWLERFSGGEASVERVEFGPFTGLHLVGVTLAVPQASGFFPPDTPLDQRTVFSAGTLLLRLSPFSIVSGQLAVPQIVAVNPRLTLVERVSDGLGNWEVMLANRQAGKTGKRGRIKLPELRLRNVEVRQYHLTDRGRVGGTLQTFFAGAVPLPDQPEVYDLSVTKIIGEDERSYRGEDGRLKIDMQTSAVSGSLPSLSLEELSYAAPPEIARWLDVLQLSGYVRAETFRIDPEAGASANLKLREARLSVPINEQEASDASLPRYLQFSNVAGAIRFENRTADVELQCLFRDASPVRIKGRLTLPEDAADLSGLGLEVELAASKVPLPRVDPETDLAEKRFVWRFDRLGAFVHDFDARGFVDLNVKLHKEAGLDKGVRFVEGVLAPQEVSAAFEEFPYRLYGVTGEVRFLRDGTIDLVNLAGAHGDGRAVINGHIGGYTAHHSVELSIQGHGIAMGDDVLEHLRPVDRDLWRRFIQRALVDLDVRLSRPAAPRDQPVARWAYTIDASFLDGAFLYAGFPYPLEQLGGRVRIERGIMRLDDLHGRRGDAIVRASGTVQRDGPKLSQLDLHLRASDIPLDDAVASAMPRGVRSLYEGCAPTGRANVSGRLFTSAEDGGLGYDVAARLSGAALTLPTGGTGGGRLTDVSAELRIVPERLTIESLEGRLGDSPLTLEAGVALDGRQREMDVHLASRSLELTDRVRSLLPQELRPDYDALAPAGRVRLDLRYHRTLPMTEAATQPALAEAMSRQDAARLSSSKSGPTPERGADVIAEANAVYVAKASSDADYVATIEPLDCRLTYEDFPLPLERVTGKVLLRPGQLDIEELSAHHGETRFLLSGHIRTQGETKRSEFSTVRVQGLTFTDQVREAVPWRLRRMWNDMDPFGRCDIDLTEAVFERGPGNRQSWRVRGEVAFDDMSLDVGPQFTEADGAITGEIGYDGQVYLDTALRLERARVAERLVTDATARVRRTAGDTSLHIHDIVAGFYGGGLLGGVDVEYAAHPPTFGLQLTARDVLLQEFLRDKQPSDAPPITASGRVEGRLALTGQFGNPASRHGSGTVLIRDAQVLKLPMVLSILRLVHFAIDDDNAFHDALFDFVVDGHDVILERIDLRGKAVSMMGAGRVHIPDRAMHLVLLVGSPLKLPEMAVLSELVEGVARELMEVHVEGTIDKPLLRAELVRSLRRTIDAMANARVGPSLLPDASRRQRDGR